MVGVLPTIIINHLISLINGSDYATALFTNAAASLSKIAD